MELPVSLPAYEELLKLGYGTEEMLQLWLELTQQILCLEGTPVLLEHWDVDHLGRDDLLQIHLDFLARVKEFCEVDQLPTPWLKRWMHSP